MRHPLCLKIVVLYNAFSGVTLKKNCINLNSMYIFLTIKAIMTV